MRGGARVAKADYFFFIGGGAGVLPPSADAEPAAEADGAADAEAAAEAATLADGAADALAATDADGFGAALGSGLAELVVPVPLPPPSQPRERTRPHARKLVRTLCMDVGLPFLN